MVADLGCPPCLTGVSQVDVGELFAVRGSRYAVDGTPCAADGELFAVRGSRYAVDGTPCAVNGTQ